MIALINKCNIVLEKLNNFSYLYRQRHHNTYMFVKTPCNDNYTLIHNVISRYIKVGEGSGFTELQRCIGALFLFSHGHFNFTEAKTSKKELQQ